MHSFFKKNLLPSMAETTANKNLVQRTKLFFVHLCTNQHLLCYQGSISSGKGDKIFSLVIWAAFSWRSGTLAAQAGRAWWSWEGNEDQDGMRRTCSSAHTPLLHSSSTEHFLVFNVWFIVTQDLLRLGSANSQGWRSLWDGVIMLL